MEWWRSEAGLLELATAVMTVRGHSLTTMTDAYRESLKAELFEALEKLEIRRLERFAEVLTLFARGRQVYNGLRTSADGLDYSAELLAELPDCVVYLTCARLQRGASAVVTKADA